MKEQLANKQVDEIGVKVLRSAYLTDEAIDEIVAAPDLFERVNAAIRAREHERCRPMLAPNRLNARTWQIAVASAAVLVVSAIVGIGIRNLASKESSPVVATAIKPSLPVTGAEPHNVNIPSETVDLPKPGNLPSVQKVNVSRTKPIRHRSNPRHVVEEPGEYYAIAYGAAADDTEDEGQTVRVEIPRTSLFAMGVDLPVENENSRVKADLVIGSDGVMKGVRIIK
jgi:hypothetical protein